MPSMRISTNLLKNERPLFNSIISLNVAHVPVWSSLSHSTSCTAKRARSGFACNAAPWRPSLDDVERISRGDAAKIRGTGSRMIPHRLNQEERKLYDFAKKKGYLTVKGTGYRRERKGSPLANIFRQYCDARKTVCVVIEQDRFGGTLDTIVVDASTLRLLDISPVLQACRQLVEPLGVTVLSEAERPLDEVPFSVIPAQPLDPNPIPDKIASAEGLQSILTEAPLDTSAQQESVSHVGLAHDASTEASTAESNGSNSPDTALLNAEAGDQDAEGSSHIHGVQLSEQVKLHQSDSPADAPLERAGAGGLDGDVQPEERDETELPSAQQENKELGEDGQEPALNHVVVVSNKRGGSRVGGKGRRVASGHPIYNCAIWQIPADPLFIQAPRPVAKEVAAQIVQQLPKLVKDTVAAQS